MRDPLLLKERFIDFYYIKQYKRLIFITLTINKQ